MEASFEYSDTLSSVLLFQTSDDAINKKERRGPKGYQVKRFVGSAEIVDLENDIIDLQALAQVMPIMIKQGGRIQSFHSNHPGGEFFDWGFTKYRGEDAIWVDVEIYDDYPSQQDNLRRILLPEGHKERINGLSLGGFKLAKKRECDAIRCWTRIMDLEGWEFSFVDKMANPLAENIENQIENMEFDSLNKEERDYSTNHNIRDSKGQFSPPISSIETITKTSYDNTNSTSASILTCECGKRLDKMENEDHKKKPKEEVKPEEESTEEVDVDVEIEAKEEEAGEETEPMEGEPPMESEEQTEEEGIAVVNSKLDTLMAALNVENIYKDKGKEKEMDEPKYVEIEGKKYIKKGDTFELVKEEAPQEPETTETTENKPEVSELEAKLEKKFEEKFKAFSEEFMKSAKSETEASNEPENPAQQEIKEDDQETSFFKKGSSVEERLFQAYSPMRN